MQDVTEVFVRARQRGSWPVESLLRVVPDAVALSELRKEWDIDTREDWFRILKTSTVLALVWVPGPLVIVTSGHQELVAEIERLTGTTVEQITVPHLDSPVLSLQPDGLAQIWPDRAFPVEAVDLSALSAHDIWYATL